MRSVSGSSSDVQANGYRLLHSNKSWVDFDSPSWSSWVTLELPMDAEVEIESNKSERVSFWSANDPKARPTVVPFSWRQAVQAILNDFVSRFRAQCVTRSDSLLFHKSSLEDSDDDDEAILHRPCFQVVFAGAKGVGKSTCLRYCLNQLLSSSNGKVAVLDADVGQPELGPPGLLSLSLVENPLLQQPHAHFLAGALPTYVRAYFYGSTTSQTDPERYMNCIRQLLQAYRTNVSSTVPLLVNLDGWVKGLGLQVLQALIQDVLQPTHTVQISGETKSRMFDLHVSPGQTLHACQAFNSSSNNNNFLLSRTDDDKQQLEEINDALSSRLSSSLSDTAETGAPPSPPVPAHSMSLPPASLRSLRLLAYFLDDDDDRRRVWDQVGLDQKQQEGFLEDATCELAHRLAAARPYLVPMETVECVCSADEDQMDLQSEESLWNAMNGSVVGLLRKESSDEILSNMLPCVGLGIVRAIDRVRRVFYILTRVEDLSSVNVLALASNTLKLPMGLIFRGVHAESSPYLESEDHADLVGFEPIKSRNTIARKSLVNNGSTR